MDFNAFQWIQDSLFEELEKQGFNAPEPLEDPDAKAVMYATDELAYSLRYDGKNQRFELRSATLDGEGRPGNWRNLSVWMFSLQTGTRGDAESILNDFLDVVRGPKRVAVVQQKRRGGKGEERSVDPLFFLNRLVNIFPELKEELNGEKITYGQVRFVTFTKEHVVPRCEDLAVRYPDSGPFKKLCSLLDDMYANGGLDLRALITVSLLNSMSDGAFASLRDGLGEELQKDVKYTRKLRGKKIKPEKKKKRKKVEARLKT